jgi:hypothetical protein
MIEPKEIQPSRVFAAMMWLSLTLLLVSFVLDIGFWNCLKVLGIHSDAFDKDALKTVAWWGLFLGSYCLLFFYAFERRLQQQLKVITRGRPAHFDNKNY